MDRYIDIRKLTLEELTGVINLYPWFGGARKELCARMNRMGEAWGVSQYADAALYISSRSKLSDLIRGAQKQDYSDADVEGLIKSFISEQETASEQDARKIHVVGGDYFSQADYDHVRRSEDHVFSRYAAKARQESVSKDQSIGQEFDMYTETLAQIYVEQGYYEQAKNIYSKLILAYPEKSAYFAALIQKLTEEINN